MEKDTLMVILKNLRASGSQIDIDGKKMNADEFEEFINQIYDGKSSSGSAGINGSSSDENVGGSGSPFQFKINGKPATPKQLMQLIDTFKQYGGVIAVNGQNMTAEQFEQYIYHQTKGAGLMGEKMVLAGGNVTPIVMNGKQISTEQLKKLVNHLKQTGKSVSVAGQTMNAAEFEAFSQQYLGGKETSHHNDGGGRSPLMMDGKPASREQLMQMLNQLRESGLSVQLNGILYNAAQFEDFINENYGSAESGGYWDLEGNALEIDGRPVSKRELMQMADELRSSGNHVRLHGQTMNGCQLKEYIYEKYGSGGRGGNKGIGDDRTVVINGKTMKKSELMVLVDRLRISGQNLKMNGRVYNAWQFEEYIIELFCGENRSPTQAELGMIFKENGASAVLAKMGKHIDDFQLQRNYTCVMKNEAEDKYGKDQMSSLPEEAFTALNTTSYVTTDGKDAGITRDQICLMEISVTARETFRE